MIGEYSVLCRGITFSVRAKYFPGSPMVMYYSDGSGHPGDPSEIELHGITVEGSDIDIMEVLDDKVIEELEETLLIRLDEEYY